MKHAHSHHGGSGAWLAGLAVIVVVLTLWMAWRLGETASISPDLQLRAPALPSRSTPNPQPAPSPISPRPG